MTVAALPIVTLLAGTVQRTQHDMLDSSMFWVGLLMALTPLLLIGGVLAYVWWSRRRSRSGPANDAKRTP